MYSAYFLGASGKHYRSRDKRVFHSAIFVCVAVINLYVSVSYEAPQIPPVITIAFERVNLMSLKSARKPGRSEFNSPYE